MYPIAFLCTVWFNWTLNDLIAYILKAPENIPPFLHTTFEVKVGRGVCSNIQWMTPSPLLVPHKLVCNVDIHNCCCKNSSFTGCVLREISSACLDTKPKGVEESCIISGDRGRPHVYVFTNMLMMELNQKLTKTCRYLEDICYGSKRGRAFAQKWHIFKSYGTMLCFLVVTSAFCSLLTQSDEGTASDKLDFTISLPCSAFICPIPCSQ